MLYSLKQNMAEATARNAGRTTSPWHGQLCMNLMAYQIFPHPDTARNVEKVYVPERERLGMELARGYERLELVQKRQELVSAQIEELTEEIAQSQLLGNSLGASEDVAAKQEWLELKKNQAQELEIEAKQLQTAIKPMQGRVDYLIDWYDSESGFEGLNERFNLRLPVVVTNGHAWVSVYLLLTGAHALHLIIGLLALAWWIPQKLTSDKSARLYVACMYWQFVDAIWLVIFWFVYF